MRFEYREPFSINADGICPREKKGNSHSEMIEASPRVNEVFEKMQGVKKWQRGVCDGIPNEENAAHCVESLHAGGKPAKDYSWREAMSVKLFSDLLMFDI